MIVSTFRVPELKDRIRLDGIVTVVDAENARSGSHDSQLVHDQIAVADVLVLNKIDLVDEVCRTEHHAWIRSISPAARIVEARHAHVPLEFLLDIGRSRPVPSGHEHDHSSAYGTWNFVSTYPLDLHRVVAALKSLPSGIFRAKGFLYLSDAPRLQFEVQVVGKRLMTDIRGPWADQPARTEIVFIGTPDATSTGEIQGIFAACAVQRVT